MKINIDILIWSERLLELLCILLTLIKGYGFRSKGFITKFFSIILFLILFAIPMKLIPLFYDNFYIYLVVIIIYSLIYIILFIDYSVYNAVASMISFLFALTTAKKLIIDLLYIIFSSYYNLNYDNIFYYPFFGITMFALTIFYQKHPLKTDFRLPGKYWFIMFLIPILAYISEHMNKTD